MQIFSSFRLELTELQPLEALWMRPKVFSTCILETGKIVPWKYRGDTHGARKFFLADSVAGTQRNSTLKKTLVRTESSNYSLFFYRQFCGNFHRKLDRLTQSLSDTPPIEAASHYAAAA